MKFLILLTILVSCASKDKKEPTPLEKKALIHYNHGTSSLVQKQYTEALRSLMEANSLKPDDTKILNNLGMAYYFKDSKDRAKSYIKRAIEVDPKNTDARLNLATIYMGEKNYSAAERGFLAILKDLTYRNQANTYFNLGKLNLAQNKTRSAINYFNKSLKENENYCPASFQLGLIDYKLRKYKQAYEQFKKASLGTCYQNPEPQFYQALSLLKMGNDSLARLKFEEVTERFSNSPYADKSLYYMKKTYKPQYNRESLSKRKRKILTPDF